MKAPNERPWLTIAEVSARLGVDVNTAYSAAGVYRNRIETIIADGRIPTDSDRFPHEGELPSYRVGEIHPHHQGAVRRQVHMVQGSGVVTPVCEYPSAAIEGERIRVERDHTGFHLSRLDRRGRRIRAMSMNISPVAANGHCGIAVKAGGVVFEDVALGVTR